MGTWGTNIDENDTFCEVYESIGDEFEEEHNIIKLTQIVLKNYKNHPEEHIAVFALAEWAWCHGLLNEELYYLALNQKEKDLKYWTDGGATKELLIARKLELERFFNKLTQPCNYSKHFPIRNEDMVCVYKGETFWYKSKGSIYGAIVLEVVQEEYYLVALTQKMRSIPQDLSVILNSELYTVAWFDSFTMINEKRRHFVGTVPVELSFIGVFGLQVSSNDVVINNYGQKRTWEHSFCILRYDHFPAKRILCPKSLPQE